jgi:hypothetical protein
MQWLDLTVPLGTIPWAVAGAVATRQYMPERLTRDLDIVVTVTDVAAVREHLNAAGYTFLGDLSIGGVHDFEQFDGRKLVQTPRYRIDLLGGEPLQHRNCIVHGAR